MAPLPANNTDRWFLDYLSSSGANQQEHTTSLRMDIGNDPATASAKFLQILNAWGAGGLRAGWRVLRLRYHAAGLDFSVPVTPSAALLAFVGTASIAGYVNVQEAVQYSWQGRSFTTGRRAGFYVFPCPSTGLNTFRTNVAPLGTTIPAALNDNTNGAVLAIDGTEVTWYTYCNVNANSYWERELRQ